MASRRDNAVSNAEVGRLLDGVEEAIEDLRISYEKYFLGVDRQAPTQKHTKVKAQLRRVEELRPTATVVRFRLSGLKARMVTFQHYWNRILSQIEKGTYRRDLQKRVQRRKEAEAAPPTREPDAPQEVSEDEDTAPRPASLSIPRKPPPPPPTVPGMKGAEVSRLFRDLVRAKKAAGEDTQGLSVRALARKLSRELPKLQQRHGGRVRFEVATVGGKVRLRARSVSES